MKADAAFAALQSADEAAHRAARQLVAMVKQQDWGKATEAYIAADSAADAMVKAAGTLLAKHAPSAR
jgi:hypothetical protein